MIAPRHVSVQARMQQMLNKTIDRHEARLERDLRHVPLWEHYMHADAMLRDSRDVVRGDVMLRRYYQALRILDENGYQRSQFQMMACKNFAAALLPLMYGRTLNRHLARILRENELDGLNSRMLLACPRRFGKTTVTAMMVAAIVSTQPGRTVNIYSPSSRASVALLKKLQKMVVVIRSKMEGIETSTAQRQMSRNAEKLEVKHTGDNRTSICFSYPSNVRAPRRPHRNRRRRRPHRSHRLRRHHHRIAAERQGGGARQ